MMVFAMESTEPILIIDDDTELCALLADFLRPEGFEVEAAFDGESGIKMAAAGKYCLLVLDVMLPGKLDGFDILKHLRQVKVNMPVLMLSARGDDIDRIQGLEAGADDYLPKPFNPRELLARIRTILRRAKAETQDSAFPAAGMTFTIGDLELNYGDRSVLRGNEPVELTSMEFDILNFLARNAGTVVTRDDLATKVLARPLSPYDRSIDVHISRLRKKLGGDDGENCRIKSVRGAGYIYSFFSARH